MDSVGLACVVFWPIILVAILIVSLVITAGGAIGVVSDRKRRGRTWRISISAFIIGLLPLLICGLPLILPKPPPPTPTPRYKLTDEPVKPFLQAINQSNRLSLGFSPISSEAQVTILDRGTTIEVYFTIEPIMGWGASRNWDIDFVKTDDTYKWAGEHESYAGPHRNENIYISYYTDAISTGDYITHAGRLPSDTLVVEYRGPDPRLTKPNLTLDDIRPVLAEWKKAWTEATPEK